MRPAPVIAGVFAQFQKFLDVQVPALQVGAHSAFPFAALVNRNRRVIYHFQERHHTLTFSIGSSDVCAQSPNWGPVIAQPTGPF